MAQDVGESPMAVCSSNMANSLRANGRMAAKPMAMTDMPVVHSS